MKLSRDHASSEEHRGARGGKHGDELTEYQLDGAIGPSSDNAEASESLILLGAVSRRSIMVCNASYAIIIVRISMRRTSWSQQVQSKF